MVDVILIGGENPVFIKEELEKTMKLFPESDRTVYYADELNLEDFFSDIRTGSLFSAKRMIVVRHADQATSDFEKLLLSYLSDPSDTVSLVLEYAKIPAKVLSLVESLGNKRALVHNFKKLWASDQKRYIVARMQSNGISMDNSVPDILVQMAGEDIEELSGMLDRLTAYLGKDKKHITDEDIHFVLERAKNSSIFDLTDAILKRNTRKALECLYDLQHAGESVPAINAMIFRSIRIMWAVKTSKDGRIPQGFAVSPYEWKKYQGFASGINLKFLSFCFETIGKIEFESKTKPDIFVQSTLEQFLYSL